MLCDLSGQFKKKVLHDLNLLKLVFFLIVELSVN